MKAYILYREGSPALAYASYPETLSEETLTENSWISGIRQEVPADIKVIKEGK